MTKMMMSLHPIPQFRAGDLLKVPVLFTNQRGLKDRPAVVVSVDEVSQSRGDLILVPISTHAGNRFGDRPVLDWQQAGLNMPTFFKAVLVTVEERSVQRVWGRLSKRDYQQVQELLREVLDV